MCDGSGAAPGQLRAEVGVDAAARRVRSAAMPADVVVAGVKSPSSKGSCDQACEVAAGKVEGRKIPCLPRFIEDSRTGVNINPPAGGGAASASEVVFCNPNN